jgi:hypothetical protein
MFNGVAASFPFSGFFFNVGNFYLVQLRVQLLDHHHNSVITPYVMKALVVRWLLLAQVKYGGFEVAQSSTTLKTLRFDGKKKEGEGFGEEGVHFKSYISQVSLVVFPSHDWVFL